MTETTYATFQFHRIRGRKLHHFPSRIIPFYANDLPRMVHANLSHRRRKIRRVLWRRPEMVRRSRHHFALHLPAATRHVSPAKKTRHKIQNVAMCWFFFSVFWGEAEKSENNARFRWECRQSNHHMSFRCWRRGTRLPWYRVLLWRRPRSCCYVCRVRDVVDPDELH